MKLVTALVAAVACGVMGCATVSSVWSTQSKDRFEAGVTALKTADYATAHRELSWVAQHYGHEKEGQRALVLLAASELDPRNPNRRVDAGADLVATYLRLAHNDEWLAPLATTMYLMATELGTTEQRAEQTERPLPRLPGPTVNARIRTVEQERDRLARRVAALEEQLAEKQREIERIRKTVKP